MNYNGKSLLKIVLNSIKKSTFTNYEILVVDNNSNDDSVDFVKKHYKSIKIIKNKKNLGYSGINSGLKYCIGKYILFLNNDMDIEKGCIRRLVKLIESDKDAVMAAPSLSNFYDKKLKSNGTWVSKAFYNGHIRSHGENAIKEIPYMGIGLIKKDFVDKFGYLFDPDYFIYAEDLDLGLRIRLAGKKILFDPNSIILHMHAVTMQKSSKSFTTFLMERNLLATFFKILSAKNIILCLPYVMLARFLAVVKDLTALRFDLALSRLKAILFILFNINFIFKKRQQVQKFRKVDDSYIFKVFSESYLFNPKFIV